MRDFRDTFKVASDPSQLRWQNRAIQATEANKTKIGAILLGVLGRTPKAPPALGGGAVITPDGYVYVDMVDRDGIRHKAFQLCDIDDLVTNFRLLADHLKLDDKDREAMFSELRKWIKKDWRANSGEPII